MGGPPIPGMGGGGGLPPMPGIGGGGGPIMPIMGGGGGAPGNGGGGGAPPGFASMPGIGGGRGPDSLPTPDDGIMTPVLAISFSFCSACCQRASASCFCAKTSSILAFRTSLALSSSALVFSVEKLQLISIRIRYLNKIPTNPSIKGSMSI